MARKRAHPRAAKAAAGDTIIVAEIYYAFTTLWSPIAYTNVLSNDTLYHRAFFRPRTGTLATIG